MSTITDPRLEQHRVIPPASAPADVGQTLRDEVLAEMARKITRPDVPVDVWTRPGYQILFSPSFDAELLKAWGKAATTKGELDQFALTLLVLAGQCRGLLRNGELIPGTDGLPLTFGHPELQAIYGALDAASAVRAFIGDDTLIGGIYVQLLEAAGEGALAMDPTTGSTA